MHTPPEHFDILVLNQIAPTGLARLPAERYRVGADIALPHAVLLRSADMHGLEIAASVRAVARAGAGTNNIPVKAMSLLGVPTAQRRLVEAQHAGGVSGYIRGAVQYVCRQLPLADNYFWHVYLAGRYRRDCCPEYLKQDNFERLKGGLVDRIETHTTTVTRFLHAHEAAESVGQASDTVGQAARDAAEQLPPPQ